MVIWANVSANSIGFFAHSFLHFGNLVIEWRNLVIVLVPTKQCDQIGQFIGLGQLFKAFGKN